MKRATSLLVGFALLAAGACSHKGDATPPPPPPAADDEDTVMCDPAEGVDPGAPPARAAGAPLVKWVDPFIGTSGVGFGVGSAFPGPQRPFGMARPGPDTSEGRGGDPPVFAHCSGYAHGDTYIEGFSQTRMHGTGISDYGTIGLMPHIGMSADKQTQHGYRQRFSHASESASPGYYAVTLDDTRVKVELTATDHVAVHRYTFPAGSDATVIVDLAHTMAGVKFNEATLAVDAATGDITGSSHVNGGYSERFGGVTTYFALHFSRPPTKNGTWANGAWASFDASQDPAVEAHIGLSFVDVEHAKKNLAQESLPFDATRSAAEAAWESALGKITVEARTDKELKLFYTALYHSLLMPTLASDVDGAYRGIDGQVAQADGFRYFTDFSLWDTYRTLHPFLGLVYPDVQREMLSSLLAMGRAYGAMPRWPLGTGETGGMLGDSAAIVFADGIARGINPVDYASAYEILKKSATTKLPRGGRDAIEEYMQKGYVPNEAAGTAASKTLEYAYDDFALSKMAAALGHAEDAATFGARAKSYKNLYDPSTRFLVGRNADGTFPGFTPTGWQSYFAEGDAWQYTFSVLHDPEGLAETFGGKDAMLAKLEQLFTHSACKAKVIGLPQPYYWAGNEPDILAPWLFAALGDGARTARYTRWILATQFGDGDDGLPGNDDSGTMSAWYMFAAMGIFPSPGSDVYFLGSPIFTKVTAHLPGGDLVIAAPDTTAALRYVSATTWNGKKLDAPRLTHADIVKGGVLAFSMSATAP